MADLAIDGGVGAVPPALQKFEHPVYDADRTADRVATDLARAASFDGGGIIREVEAAFRAVLNAEYALAVNSGTSALYACYFALGLGAGDRVLVPAYTFYATAMPLFRLGCVPIPVDCGPNGNVTASSIEDSLTEDIRALVVTHMWGIPCEMDPILKLASAHGIPVVEDASHAHGAKLGGRNVGSFGSMAAWSLGAKKIVTGGLGGMVQTADDNLYQRAFVLSRSNDKTHDRGITGPEYLPYAVTGAGMNLRMHPFAALLIEAQLRKLTAQVDERRAAVAAFLAEVGETDVLRPPTVPFGADPSWYALPMMFDAQAAGISRGLFVRALHAEGAVEVDIPGSTRTITGFAAFRGDPPAFPGAPAVSMPAGEHPGAARYESSLIKFPFWYGVDGIERARAYGRATRKVLNGLAHLSKIGG